MVGDKYRRRYDYLDEINAEERMRREEMTNADAVDELMEEFDIGYGAANNTSYSYRKERGLID
jgi:hypothetical protein